MGLWGALKGQSKKDPEARSSKVAGSDDEDDEISCEVENEAALSASNRTRLDGEQLVTRFIRYVGSSLDRIHSWTCKWLGPSAGDGFAVVKCCKDVFSSMDEARLSIPRMGALSCAARSLLQRDSACFLTT